MTSPTVVCASVGEGFTADVGGVLEGSRVGVGRRVLVSVAVGARVAVGGKVAVGGGVLVGDGVGGAAGTAWQAADTLPIRMSSKNLTVTTMRLLFIFHHSFRCKYQIFHLPESRRFKEAGSFREGLPE